MSAGYTATEARAIASKIDRIARNAKIEEYRIYCAEVRACGSAPETLDVFLNEAASGKAAASSRMAMIPSDELDLH